MRADVSALPDNRGHWPTTAEVERSRVDGDWWAEQIEGMVFDGRSLSIRFKSGVVMVAYPSMRPGRMVVAFGGSPDNMRELKGDS